MTKEIQNSKFKKNIFKSWYFFVIWILCFVIFSCGEVVITELEPADTSVDESLVDTTGVTIPTTFYWPNAYARFYVNVYPVLERSFCTVGCHVAANKEANGNLDLSDSKTAFNDLANGETSGEEGGSRINVDTPAQSLLLTEGLIAEQENKTDHKAGDTIWTTESADYLTILEWITWLGG